MEATLQFGDVLEAVDALTLDEQETVVDVLRRRIAERRREELAEDVEEAYREFLAGNCKPCTPDELMAEVLG